MPAKPAWLLHIPEIVAQLETFDVPVVDRAIVERLFGLRRRQAIELMHHFGGFQAAKTFLVDRQQLIAKLRVVAEGEDFQAEAVRKQRLVDTMDRVRRDRVAMQIRIPVTPDVWSHKLKDLPEGIILKAGHLNIDFAGAEDLLSKLYQLAVAAANDFDRLRGMAEPVNRIAAK